MPDKVDAPEDRDIKETARAIAERAWEANRCPTK